MVTRFGLPRKSCAAVFLLYPLFVSAALKNVTIDDENNDELSGAAPTYVSFSAWKQGATCDGCNNMPDPSKAFGGTWHDATLVPGDSPIGVEIQFSGTAIYAFYIIGRTQGIYTNTQLDIELDGSLVGSYIQPPVSFDGDDYQFNVPVYSNSNVNPGSHTLRVMAMPESSALVTMLFDYVVFSIDEDTATDPNSSRPQTTTDANPSAPSVSFLRHTSSGESTVPSPSSQSSPIPPPTTQSASTLTSSLESIRSQPPSPNVSFSSSTLPPSSTPSSMVPSANPVHFSRSLLVGIVVGGTIAILAAIIALYHIRRRHGRRVVEFNRHVVPYMKRDRLRTPARQSACPSNRRKGEQPDWAFNDASRCSSTAMLHSANVDSDASDYSPTSPPSLRFATSNVQRQHEIERRIREVSTVLDTLSAHAPIRLSVMEKADVVSDNPDGVSVRRYGRTGDGNDRQHSEAFSEDSAASMSDIRSRIIEMQAELGWLRTELRSIIGTNVQPPAYAQ